MRTKAVLGALAVALILAGGVAFAQTTMVEVKQGMVMAVHGNELVYRGPEGVKSVNVPDDFRFDMGGEKLSVHQLKPGMRLTATITTTQRPVEMTATEVRAGTILHTQGGAVIVRKDDGKVIKFTSKTIKESGAVVTKGGKPIDITTLRAGDRIEATVVSRLPPEMVTEEQLKVYAANAPKPAQRKPAPVAPKPRQEPPPAMPKTSSELPLIGLLGLVLLAIGAGLTVLRKFS